MSVIRDGAKTRLLSRQMQALNAAGLPYTFAVPRAPRARALPLLPPALENQVIVIDPLPAKLVLTINNDSETAIFIATLSRRKCQLRGRFLATARAVQLGEKPIDAAASYAKELGMISRLYLKALSKIDHPAPQEDELFAKAGLNIEQWTQNFVTNWRPTVINVQ